MKVLSFLIILLSCSLEPPKPLKPVEREIFELNEFFNQESNELVSKISLSRRYQGPLFFEIPDIEKFEDKQLIARFTFGLNKDFEIEMSGGIQNVPEANNKIKKLFFVNFTDELANANLKYQLYDYNNYSDGKDIIYDNTNLNLFCRGLNLADDPTANSETCSKSDDTCLYSFANVKDMGLVKVSSDPNGFKVKLNPTRKSFSVGQGAYTQDSDEHVLEKCLSDSTQPFVKNKKLSLLEKITLKGEQYSFEGMFNSISQSQWHIKDDAIWGRFGIFRSEMIGGKNVDLGFQSNLFPREGKLRNNLKVQYLGSQTTFGEKEITEVVDANGETDWIDGCNLRIKKTGLDNSNYGSCTVTSNIEIFYKENGEEVILASNALQEKPNQLKLQIVSELKINNEEIECQINSQCDSGCCRNNICFDSIFCDPPPSAKPVGDTCGEDLECVSRCCKAGVCKAHGNGNTCDKEEGESCSGGSFCGKKTVYWSKRIFSSVSNNICSNQNCNETERMLCVNKKCVHPFTNEELKNSKPDERVKDPSFLNWKNNNLEDDDCSTAVNNGANEECDVCVNQETCK